jgi:spore maturation protein CgeB
VFTISDYRAEVAEIFGDAVPTFTTPAELQDLVLYYLEHDDERQEKAARLPGLIAGHTFGHRAATLTSVLEGYSRESSLRQRAAAPFLPASLQASGCSA